MSISGRERTVDTEEAGSSGVEYETAPPLSPDEAPRRELELAVRMKLRVVFSSSRVQSRQLARHAGVSASQLVALAEIARRPGIRISEFAHLRSIKNSTASNLLDKLERRGWARRERNGPDQRIVRLFVTTEGQRTLEQSPVPVRGIVTSALGQLSDQTLAALDSSLGELVATLEMVHGEGALTSVKDL